MKTPVIVIFLAVIGSSFAFPSKKGELDSVIFERGLSQLGYRFMPVFLARVSVECVIMKTHDFICNSL